MKKCDYCEKKSKYSMGIITHDNKEIDIQACNEHLNQGRARQEHELREDKAKFNHYNINNLE